MRKLSALILAKYQLPKATCYEWLERWGGGGALKKEKISGDDVAVVIAAAAAAIANVKKISSKVRRPEILNDVVKKNLTNCSALKFNREPSAELQNNLWNIVISLARNWLSLDLFFFAKTRSSERMCERLNEWIRERCFHSNTSKVNVTENVMKWDTQKRCRHRRWWWCLTCTQLELSSLSTRSWWPWPVITTTDLSVVPPLTAAGLDPSLKLGRNQGPGQTLEPAMLTMNCRTLARKP